MLKRIAPALVLAALFAPSLASAQTVPWTPPPCFSIFNDVPCTPYVGFSDWIEALSVEGVTAGCGGGNYCPDLPVTRAQMAISDGSFTITGMGGAPFFYVAREW